MTYVGLSGACEVFYIAEVDRAQQPREGLSGHFASRTEALSTLRWLRRRHPRARLIRELVYRSIEA